ncbi:Snf7-domain-containing protein [Ascobolus immersus RN42]|uniref:Vacuolar-sorting protein SNF7 n=1 Tax=Ascobolus immersus RN42 TaxID=1160509 RepID=A0A3N4IHC7_ASCIM|nr:Snf7-domain-containing protein [Ascobolus immersus RN42]
MFSLSWFTGGNTASKRKDETKKAIINLREQLEVMRKKEKLFETQIAAQTDIARKNATTNKTVALAALKRRKLTEQSLSNLSNQIMTIEQQIHSIENAHLNAETLRIMKQAGTAMKKIHQDLSIDKVENVMDEIRDQNLLATEINDAITGGTYNAVDEADLDEELAQMQQEALDDKILKAPAAPVSGKIYACSFCVKMQINNVDSLLIMASPTTRCSAGAETKDGRRRGRRAEKVTGRDDDSRLVNWWLRAGSHENGG